MTSSFWESDKLKSASILEVFWRASASTLIVRAFGEVVVVLPLCGVEVTQEVIPNVSPRSESAIIFFMFFIY